MGMRRKSRVIALNTLYQSEIKGVEPLDSFPLLCENFEVNQKAIPYASVLLEGISRNWMPLNDLIAECAKNWRLDRMSIIDRNIIRIAVYEMCYLDDVPPRVAINEAIEIAKQYCTDDAPSFINGILDAVRLKKTG
jgi:N utilization substance protein B